MIKAVRPASLFLKLYGYCVTVNGPDHQQGGEGKRDANGFINCTSCKTVHQTTQEFVVHCRWNQTNQSYRLEVDFCSCLQLLPNCCSNSWVCSHTLQKQRSHTNSDGQSLKTKAENIQLIWILLIFNQKYNFQKSKKQVTCAISLSASPFVEGTSSHLGVREPGVVGKVEAGVVLWTRSFNKPSMPLQ